MIFVFFFSFSFTICYYLLLNVVYDVCDVLNCSVVCCFEIILFYYYYLFLLLLLLLGSERLSRNW